MDEDRDVALSFLWRNRGNQKQNTTKDNLQQLDSIIAQVSIMISVPIYFVSCEPSLLVFYSIRV